MRAMSVGIACWLLASAGVAAADLPDLGKLDRKIAKEPAYTCKKPLYGLLVFGPKAEERVWLVLDKSKADAASYAVLYLDRNADGDLTVPDKRLTSKSADQGGQQSTVFTLPQFRDPATGAMHSEFRVQVTGQDAPTVMVSLKWQAKQRLGGGYPPDPGEYMKLAPRPASAPVVWFQGDGPFRFQGWCSGKLQIGAADDFKVFLGQIGSGASTFCAFQEHVLPAGEGVQATLIYQDQAGKEHREVYALKDRC
jgi:hypothetical protein